MILSSEIYVKRSTENMQPAASPRTSTAPSEATEAQKLSQHWEGKKDSRMKMLGSSILRGLRKLSISH